jgi:hypothetical protein
VVIIRTCIGGDVGRRNESEMVAIGGNSSVGVCAVEGDAVTCYYDICA